MSKGIKYFLTGLAIAAGILALWYFSAIVIYLLVAMVLSLIGQPLMRFLKMVRIKKFIIPRGLAAAITMLSLLLVFLSFAALFIPLVVDEARIISSVNTSDVMGALEIPLEKTERIINQYQREPISLRQYLQEQITSVLSFGQVSDVANAIAGITGNLFIAFFAICFFTFFFLKDGRVMFETLLMLVPPQYVHDAREIVDDCRRLLVKYFVGVCLDVLCVFILVSFGLYLVGVKHALIIGFFAGIVNVVPYIGPLIAASFGIVIGFSANLEPEMYGNLLPQTFKIISVFVAVNLIDAFFLQPLIFSNTVKAHPMEVFLVILIAGTLAGIGGMVVAIPTYTVLRVIAKQFLSKFRIVRKLTEDLEE